MQIDHQYDQYQQDIEDKDSNCNYCGEASEKDFCDSVCYRAYIND